MLPVFGDGSGYTEICVCGRAFFKQSAYTNHKRSCRKSQKYLTSALDKAKQRWYEKKKQRLLSSSAAGDLTDIPNSEIIVDPSALSASEQVCQQGFISKWCQASL